MYLTFCLILILSHKHTEKLESGGRLSEFEVKFVCEKVKELLLEESNVQAVHSPVTICGDVHGQFYDVRELFKVRSQVPLLLSLSPALFSALSFSFIDADDIVLSHCCRLEVLCQTQITSFWATMSIVDTTQWRQSHCSHVINCAIRIASHCCVVTTSPDRLHRCMASIASVSRNMATAVSGITLQTCLTT